jgi:hypothetical protein
MKITPALALVLSLAVGSALAQDAQEHKNRAHTFSLLPGKTLNIQNKSFHRVEIRSEYPVQISAGNCHIEYTVQWLCTFRDPADLFIRDLRHEPIFATPRANAVTVTESAD